MVQTCVLLLWLKPHRNQASAQRMSQYDIGRIKAASGVWSMNAESVIVNRAQLMSITHFIPLGSGKGFRSSFTILNISLIPWVINRLEIKQFYIDIFHNSVFFSFLWNLIKNVSIEMFFTYWHNKLCTRILKIQS